MISTDIPIPRLAAIQRRAVIAAAAGVVLCLIGLFTERERFFQSYLFAFMFFANISLGCLALVMLHHMTNGKWSFSIQRFLEAGMRTVPFIAILFIPVLLGMSDLYPWMHPERLGEAAIKKVGYLNQPFFIGRAVFYFAVWSVMALFLGRWSRAQDTDTGRPRTHALRMLSAPGLVIFSLTVTFAVTDWVMSLEPDWHSTIYGMLFMVDQALVSLTLAIILLRSLLNTRPFAGLLTPAIFNDLGNMVLTLVILWAYMSFSQLLIIWSGNLPDEISWYVRRLDPGWRLVGLALLLLHFFVPFLLLLSRRSKRSPEILWKIAAGLLVMRLIDLYWLVEPAFSPMGLAAHWLDLAVLLAVGGAWVALAVQMLKGAPLLAVRDPRFAIVAEAAAGAHHG